LRATRVVRLPITQASAKVRTGPPIEETDDLALPYWGGVVPVSTEYGVPVADDHVRPDVEPPRVDARPQLDAAAP
jgi:hypothetical protein